MSSAPPTVHVEIALKQENALSRSEIKTQVRALLLSCNDVTPGARFKTGDLRVPLCEHIRSIKLCDAYFKPNTRLHPTSVELVFHIYTPNMEGPVTEAGDNDENVSPPSTHWSLPCEDLMGLWETLVYDVNIKDQLLSFIETAAFFADKGVDAKIINWNRVVLLHGPPGTGKTSLCKALAQKLSIRLNKRYSRTELVEINSHSLFSKWFSESGKLVTRMFEHIRAIAEDRDTLVCILIDEVESLTHARKASMNGAEPSDSIRVVNAVLTQIDQMQQFPNVLILTTSNMSGAIDLAFVDRADIRQYVGLPSTAAVYHIYLSCLKELMDKGILKREQLFGYDMLESYDLQSHPSNSFSMKLLKVAKKSDGISGRSLRKLPFLAFSLLRSGPAGDLTEFLNAMELAIEKRVENVCENNAIETVDRDSISPEIVLGPCV